MSAKPRAKYDAGAAEDFPAGSITIVPVGKYGVGILNVEGRLYAMTNYCSHRGAPLCKGTVTGIVVTGDEAHSSHVIREGEFLKCPRHGWQFELASGRSHINPDRKIRAYPVTVENGRVLLEVT